MSEFALSRYLSEPLPDEQRGPAQTVLEYVAAYQKWARDCHFWVRQHPDRIAQLQTGEAKATLSAIQKKYCSPKNRQFHRASTGYFFYGGTADVNPVLASCSQTDDRSALVTTEKKKPHSPAFRFTLKKQGKVWLIDSLQRLSSSGQWLEDSL